MKEADVKEVLDFYLTENPTLLRSLIHDALGDHDKASGHNFNDEELLKHISTLTQNIGILAPQIKLSSGEMRHLHRFHQYNENVVHGKEATDLYRDFIEHNIRERRAMFSKLCINLVAYYLTFYALTVHNPKYEDGRFFVVADEDEIKAEEEQGRDRLF